MATAAAVAAGKAEKEKEEMTQMLGFQQEEGLHMPTTNSNSSNNNK
jgi:hypothetical protein